jgi:glycosyltransferase involved in cell wall biosynthesis
MQVCHILFELRLGGIGAVLQNYALGMDENSTMTCIIFRMTTDEVVLERYHALLSHPNVTIINLNKRIKKDHFKTLVSLVKIFRKQQFDMVFSHLEETTRYVWWLTLLTKNKLTQVIHNQVFHDLWLHHLLLRHILSGYIFVSLSSMNAHRALKHAAKTTIHNGIIMTPQLSRQREGFLFVGRMEYQKNPLECIRLYQNAIKQVDNPWPLTMIGNGPLLNELEEYIKSHNLSDHLTLIHSTTNVDEWYAKSLCGLITSHYEGTPMILLEGMNQGCPFISYDVGDIKEVMGENTGIIILPMQTKIFEEAMVRVMNDNTILSHFSKQASLTSAKFTAQSMVNNYERWIIERTKHE